MANLKRTHHQLEKAQKKLDRYSKSGKQFQFQFVRKADKKNNFHTKLHVVRGEKEYKYSNKGVFHKLVNQKSRIIGDKPSITKQLQSIQPTTWKGHVAKKTAQAVNFIAHGTTQTAVDVGLGVETVGRDVFDKSRKTIHRKYIQKYKSEALDDYHKGLIKLGGTTADAVKGTYSHFKQKKQFKLQKAKYKLKKAEYKLFNAEKLKDNLKKHKSQKYGNKLKLKKLKGDFTKFDKSKQVVTKEDQFNRNVRQQRFKKRSKQYKILVKQNKNKIKQLKSEKKFKRKELKKQWKIANYSRPTPLVFKPVSYTGKQMTASTWQKTVNEDENNDFLKIADEVKRHGVDKAVENANPHKLKERNQKKKSKLDDKKGKKQKKLKNQEFRLKEKHADATDYSRKTRNKKKNNPLFAFIKTLKNMSDGEAKKFFLCLMAIVIVMLLVFSFILMIFSSIAGSSGFVLGTYCAQDYDLSQAEIYYTKLANNMNQKILKVGDKTNWKNGLKSFGVDTSKMKDNPDTWYWGYSSVFKYTPTYDFDTYKLWAFLCAYYYDFSKENGDIKYWKYNSSTESLIYEIFNDEYVFNYYYDNTSHWEQLSTYGYDNQYYYTKGSGTAGKYGYVEFYNVPSTISKYANKNVVYFSLSNGEILNYKDSFESTGYYFQDQRYIVRDPSGNEINPFYSYDTSAYKTSYSKGYGKYYVINGKVDVWMPKSYWSFDMSNGKDFADNFCVEVAPNDVTVYKYGEKCSGPIGYWSVAEHKDLYYGEFDRDSWIEMCVEYQKEHDKYQSYGYCSFYKKYKWVEDCRLYYNVKQNKTFDKVLKDKLKSMSYSSERLDYYNLLVGNQGTNYYGNHETLQSIFSSSIHDHNLTNGFGYDMQAWNTTHCKINSLHEGVDVVLNENTKLYAPFDCKITKIDTTTHSVILRKDDVEYWYDGSGGTKRDTEVYLTNVNLVSGLSVGSTIKQGDYFAKSTGNKNCDTTITNNNTCHYVHIKVKIDTDGYGWDFIDPRLVFY